MYCIRVQALLITFINIDKVSLFRILLNFSKRFPLIDYGIVWQRSFWACFLPMRDDVTTWRRLSLAGRTNRRIPGVGVVLNLPYDRPSCRHPNQPILASKPTNTGIQTNQYMASKPTNNGRHTCRMIKFIETYIYFNIPVINPVISNNIV